jgi:hypothetical protein
MQRDSDTSFPFFSAVSLWRADCIISLCRHSTKENNNDANGSAGDSLAESDPPSTSATLGAGHAEFSIRSLFASGIGFHPSGIVLGHDI